MLRIDVGKSVSAGSLPRRRLGDAAGHGAQTAPLTDTFMDQDAVPLRSAPPLVRADLHVHSCHSLRSGNFRFLRSRDCYSRPEDVYRVAKARGMDVVTITDHDSIDGCLEFLDRHPGADDFFVSEEVSCWFPDAPIEVHFGVYGMTEALHAAIQPLRRNVFEVAAALRRGRRPLRAESPASFLSGPDPARRLPAAARRRACARDPQRRDAREHNELVEEIAATWPGGRRIALAGSDAHTLRRVGRTWTAAPAAPRGSSREPARRTRADRRCARRCRRGRGRRLRRDRLVRRQSASGSARAIMPCCGASLCLLFAIGSLPCQFLPSVIAADGKRAERRTVARAARELDGVRPGQTLV